MSYISEAWGGRVSDKYQIENCGLFQHLLPGDAVLSGMEFDISDLVGMMQARWHIPAHNPTFTKGMDQFPAMVIEEMHVSVNFHIH